MSNSAEYWKQRNDELHKIYEKESLLVVNELKKAYLKSFNEITTEVKAYKFDNKSYNELATENLLAKIEAILNALFELEESTLTENLMNFYVTTKARVVNFVKESDIKNIVTETISEAGRMVTKTIDMLMYNVPNLKAVELVIKEKFLGHNYSDRIWNNKAKLSVTLKDSLTEGLIRGEGIKKISNRVNKQMGTSFYNCERLVRTEMDRVMSKAELDGYAEMGIEEFEILTARDNRVCDKCKAMDGKIFKIADAKPGINYTLHPNGRCDLLPVNNIKKR